MVQRHVWQLLRENAEEFVGRFDKSDLLHVQDWACYYKCTYCSYDGNEVTEAVKLNLGAVEAGLSSSELSASIDSTVIAD